MLVEAEGQAPRTCLARPPQTELDCPTSLSGRYPGPVSPDGQSLLLVHPTADGDLLERWSPGDSAPTHLAGPASPLREPRWSTDGGHISFRATLAGRTGVWRVAAMGGPPEQLTTHVSGDFEPHEGPSGVVVARSGARGTELWLQPPTGDATALTDDESDDVHPRWSPEGERLAWLSDRSGTRQVWVREADGSTRAMPGGPHHGFSWAPDGQRIALIDRAELRIQPLTGEATTAASGVDPSPVSWSPDGRALAWTTADGHHTAVQLQHDGAVLTLRQPEASVWLPRWLK